MPYGTAQFKFDTHARVLSPSLNKSDRKLGILLRVVRKRLDKVMIVTNNMHVKFARVYSRAGVTRETSTRVTVYLSCTNEPPQVPRQCALEYFNNSVIPTYVYIHIINSPRLILTLEGSN